MSVASAQRDSIRQNFLTESAWYRVSSPLFSAVAQAAAADDDIIDLVSEARPGQSQSVLLFCIVHYLLLKTPELRLSRYFQSLTASPEPAARAFPAFKEYCLQRRTEVTELLSWRTVNTNLAEKTSCLVPALRHVEKLSDAPLTLLELCCSAGLNMLFDEYHHDYGAGCRLGVASSPVQLKCKIVGPNRPPLSMPTIGERVGIDLVKVNVADPLERLWMEAVLFPEWMSERERLKAALSIRTQRDLRIIEGDALKVVEPLLEQLPGRLCVLMSYCIGHWSLPARRALDDLFRRVGRHRPIHRLDVDPPDSESPQTARTRLSRLAQAGIPVLKKKSAFRLDHTVYSGGTAHSQLLGEGDVFGEWLDWHIPEAEQQLIRLADNG